MPTRAQLAKNQSNKKKKQRNRGRGVPTEISANGTTITPKLMEAMMIADQTEPYNTYDTIRAFEVVNGVEPETYINQIRALHEGRGRWEKKAPDLSYDGGAFHAWLEDADGNIIDPHFPQYDGMMKMPNCDPHQKVYSEWSTADQIVKLKHLIRRSKEIVNRNMVVNGLSEQEVINILAHNPIFRCCHQNAYTMKCLRPELKYKIGNMGFRSRDDPNKIWWEY